MSHILFTPYSDNNTTFSAAEMNKPLESFDESIIYMKNTIITCDGDIVASSTSGNFSFTGKIRILFTSPIDGLLVQNVVQDGLIKMELGDCVYVDLNGVNNTTLTLQKVKLLGGAQSTMKANRVLIAYRNDVTGEIYLANTLHKMTNGGGQAAERIVTLVSGTVVTAGQILCLTSDGKYTLADNAQIGTTQDLVMVKAAGMGEASVIELGLLTVVADFTVGAPIYLGNAGSFTQYAPTQSGSIVKCIGWAVAENVLKFKPDSIGLKLI